jgi:Xaa-Pro aminopeptidase
MTKNSELPLNEIQNALIQEKLDGWLLYDFRGSNPVARSIAKLADHITTRRWYYFIPAKGSPVRVVHAIEATNLDHLPGEKIIFRTWQDLRSALTRGLKGAKKVAMEYSPENDVPYISLVDAGTIELLRSTGAEVVSSADLVQMFEARWTDEQRDSHFEAAQIVDRVKNKGFEFIGESLRANKPIGEYDVQQYMWDLFRQNDVVADHPMIVAANANASNPHYAPDENHSSPIKKGDLVLIDIWAKQNKPGAIYGDITWMGYAGSEVPAKMKEIFDIVKGAQQASFNLIRTNFAEGKVTYGWQADDAARNYIAERGYGDYYLHRTGHNIGQQVHGNGANLDNLETRDRRKLIPRTGFSIEPGIYLPEFGVRSEIDVYIGEDGPVITSPHQTEILTLL